MDNLNLEEQKGMEQKTDIPPRPDSMTLAIMSTLFCCLPLGIVSIVYASKATTLYDQRQYSDALKVQKKADNIIMINMIVFGLINIFLFSCVMLAR